MDSTLCIVGVALTLMEEIPHYTRRLIWAAMAELGDSCLDTHALHLQLPYVPRHWRERLCSAALRSQAEQVCLWASDHGVEVCPIGSEGYPPLLAQCADAPLVLYRRGHMPPWSAIALPLAVVGARDLSTEGARSLRLIVRELAYMELPTLVISGLALGADIVAHRAALEVGVPTLAVLPAGLDAVYPRRHRPDAQRILEHGAWLTEYPPHTALRREHFVQRNRIIAGAAWATLVVEAGLPSGTYTTALRAWGYDRDVLVLPSRIDEPRCRGGYRLVVHEQASLVTSARDIVRKVRGW